MGLYVCDNIFNLVKVYTCCCKIFKELTFFLDKVYSQIFRKYKGEISCPVVDQALMGAVS